MKIGMLYNKENSIIREKVEEIKAVAANSKYLKKGNVEFLSGIGSCDIYLIFSNSIDEIKEYSNEILSKNKIFVITSRKENRYVLDVINITNNLHYLWTNSDLLFDNIVAKYEEINYEN